MRAILITLLLAGQIILASACSGTDTPDSNIEEDFEIELASDEDPDNSKIVNGVKATASPSEDDIDADSILDDNDNCPTVTNTDQSDRDNDGIGDSCEI